MIHLVYYFIMNPNNNYKNNSSNKEVYLRSKLRAVIKTGRALRIGQVRRSGIIRRTYED